MTSLIHLTDLQTLNYLCILGKIKLNAVSFKKSEIRKNRKSCKDCTIARNSIAQFKWVPGMNHWLEFNWNMYGNANIKKNYQ